MRLSAVLLLFILVIIQTTNQALIPSSSSLISPFQQLNETAVIIAPINVNLAKRSPTSALIFIAKCFLIPIVQMAIEVLLCEYGEDFIAKLRRNVGDSKPRRFLLKVLKKMHDHASKSGSKLGGTNINIDSDGWHTLREIAKAFYRLLFAMYAREWFRECAEWVVREFTDDGSFINRLCLRFMNAANEVAADVEEQYYNYTVDKLDGMKFQVRGGEEVVSVTEVSDDDEENTFWGSDSFQTAEEQAETLQPSDINF